MSPSEHVEQSAEAFIYQLYQKGQSMLPPTKDSFHQHLLRANYHCCLWKHSLSIHEVDSPIGNGWIKEDNSLRPVLVTQQAAPMDLVELVRCGCKTGCTRGSCSCRKNNMSCAASCSCFHMEVVCANPFTQLSNDSDESGDDESEEEDN